MHKNQEGALLIPLIMAIVLFLLAGVFAIWAYAGRQDYKTNVDQKVQVAVTKAVADEDVKKDAQFAEDEKKPLRNYQSPEAFGSVSVDYPKTWSVYALEVGGGSTPVDVYFNPRYVPNANSNGPFALRMQVLNSSYTIQLQQFDALTKNGKVKVTPFRFVRVPDVLGVRIEGQILPRADSNGVMVLVPLRDKTLRIWTEGTQSLNDFNNNILPNMTFSP
jgi:hypothetical protein